MQNTLLSYSRKELRGIWKLIFTKITDETTDEFGLV